MFKGKKPQNQNQPTKIPLLPVLRENLEKSLTMHIRFVSYFQSCLSLYFLSSTEAETTHGYIFIHVTVYS